MHIRASGKYTENSKRSIQKVKQRPGCMLHSTPYRYIPNLMIAQLFIGAVK